MTARSLAKYWPQLGVLLAMLLLAIVVDLVLHLMGQTELGRYAGYVGSVLIVLSFAYSVKKHKLAKWGSPQGLLTFHKVTAWVGPVLVIVHGGIHFHGLLPWLAMLSMVVVVASGLVGSVLLSRARSELTRKRAELTVAGASAAEAEHALHHEAMAVAVMKRWREIHLPITAVFVVLALFHVVTVTMFWSW